MKPLKTILIVIFASAALTILQACRKLANTPVTGTGSTTTTTTTTATVTALQAAFGANIDLTKLENYANQTVPRYINNDNSGGDPITDAGATLGRVLFYDKNLSISNKVACASCHKQSMAFGDSLIQSIGVNGPTVRHSQRLVNARFAQEVRFFWDKRAATLEDQTIQPILTHNELGYSGLNGDPDINALVAKLQAITYYQQLFKFVYGDSNITVVRLQSALAQFIRSIQSFDSRFDAGLAQTGALNQDFANFTALENQGKALFLGAPSPLNAPVVTGAGCQTCHRAPTFDIDPNSKNNGIIGVAGSTTLIDITNTNPPSLRNLLNPAGKVNGLYMHNGVFNNLLDVVNHYDQITVAPANTNLDPRLGRNGVGQSLRLSAAQKSAIIAFLGTLSGNDVYTNKKWANPFISQ
jgi:cytochrome c peroxidase